MIYTKLKSFLNTNVFFLIFLTISVFAIYGKSVSFEFIDLDDDILILNNIDYISNIKNIPNFFTTSCYYSYNYHYFKLSPIGKYNISVCMGTACYVKGANEVLETVKEILDIKIGETTKDMLFSLQEARCIGACGLAPVVMINDKIYGELNSKKITDIINDLKKQENEK